MRRLAIGICLTAVLTSGSNVTLADENKAQVPKTGSIPAPAQRTPRKWTGPKRSWGPEQVTGEADTPGAGDLTTAWASATPDEQAEWLICEFEKPVQAIFLRVHETYNPGALVKVTAFGADGKEVTAWEGEDPTPKGEQRGVSKIPIALGADVQRFKLYIDSPAVRGWNEIDAVAAEDETGKLHWAVNVQASSTFAGEMVDVDAEVVDVERRPRIMVAPPPSPLDILQRDIADLKKREAQQSEEIRALRNELRELKDLLKKSPRPTP